VVERDRAFVIDTMTFPEMTQGMVREIQRHGAHVETVLNTHHHIDHMGGNQVFTDAHIIAHPGTIQAVQRLGLPAPIYDRLMPQFQGRFTALSLVVPEPLQEQGVPWLDRKGGAQLLTFTPAHTPADVAVWFPETCTLLTGDVCFIGVVPLSVNGLISGWITALDALIALKPDVVVPGHGPVGTLADLITLREYFATIERLGRRAVAEQVSLQDALAEFDPGPLAAWIEAERHAINLERVMQEARGEISPADLSAMPLSARKS
jgi:glyoxylase-like metal-dependent hydrolase (beta-lactamase superfamily II)